LDDRELIADLITGVELPQVRVFARQMMITPAIDDMGKRSLLARFIRVYPEIEELIHEGKEEEQEEALIVSWKSLAEKKKAYDHLVNVELPKNREDISIARSYGDLRENFEYKSAKEYARVLARRKFEMERDLQRAQGTDFADTVTDRVSIGTTVDLVDCASAAEERFSILGAWDTDLTRHIISYLSITGAALLGRTVGDEVDLPTEESNISRRVRITAIDKAEIPS
jgi:transcription elongation GreA/GreB family factor